MRVRLSISRTVERSIAGAAVFLVFAAIACDEDTRTAGGADAGATAGSGGFSGGASGASGTSGMAGGSAGSAGSGNGGSGGSAGAGTGGEDAAGAGGSDTGGTSGGEPLDAGADTGGSGDSGSSGSSDDSGTTDPDAGAGCTLAWSSGFENGFPGEWLNYDNGSYSANGTMPAGRVSAWTIIDSGSGEPIYSGEHGYKGWIVAAAAESHRAYPGIHTDIPTPAVNTFMVNLDADYGQMGPSEWIHFGTWGNEDDQGNGVWALHTMSVRDSKLEFAHTNPFSGEYIGPAPRPDFPLRQWIRFTVYIHYEGTTGTVQVWQDGVPMLRAEVSALAADPGTNLTRAHWGMYASAETTQGIQYNDDVRIWTLDQPLTDLDTEPDCYLKPE